MIAHAIRAAQESGLFARVLVSTDDAEIMEVARAAGAEVPFVRPAVLADDMTPTVPVIQHAIQTLGVADGVPVCCIYACVPFLAPADLVAGLALLETEVAPYAFPVTAFPSPIQRALRLGADGRVAPFFPENVSVRTQDLEPAYHDAGQFYWGRARSWAAGLSLHGHGAGLLIPAWRVVDIDTPEDWERAEAMARAILSAP
jgi:pseudaminic acid cytidylyltransferase